jgi:hypothetical protein
MMDNPIKKASSNADAMMKECMHYGPSLTLQKHIGSGSRFIFDHSLGNCDAQTKQYVKAMYQCFWYMRDIVAVSRKKTGVSRTLVGQTMFATKEVANDVLQSILTERVEHSAVCLPLRKVGGVTKPVQGAVVGPMWLKRVHGEGLETPIMGKRKVLALRVRRKDAYHLRPEGIDLFEASVFVPTRDGLNLNGYIFRVKAGGNSGSIVTFNRDLRTGLTMTRNAISERVLKEL